MLETLNGWIQSGSIPEVGWGKTKKLEFQEVLQRRDELASHLPRVACTSCPDFDQHVSFPMHFKPDSKGLTLDDGQYLVVHAKKVLQENIANLKLAISDENLELLPDYEQRIEVLKELKFIDDNSTVLLKGRVACEVSHPLPPHICL